MTISGDVGAVAFDLKQAPTQLLPTWLAATAGVALTVEITHTGVAVHGWIGWAPMPSSLTLTHPVHVSWKRTRAEVYRGVQRWELTFVSEGEQYTADGVQCTREELLDLSTQLVRAGLQDVEREGQGPSEVPRSLADMVDAAED